MADLRRVFEYAAVLALGASLAFGSLMSGARAASIPTISTIIVGGSAAKGWNDPIGHGYVERGLTAYGEAEGVRFAIKNYAIRGAPVVDRRVARAYPTWLERLGPNGIVVLAWGMLNDLRLGTPPGDVEAALNRQIALALAHRDLVLVVTPPVTRLSVGKWRLSEADLVRLEVSVAERFRSPRVHVVNTYFPELHVWRTRHYNYRRFMYNGYDPNRHGYALAGHILARELESSWNVGPTVPADPGALVMNVR